MKIPAPCPICFREQREKEKADPGRKEPLVLWPGRMTDDGYVVVRCERGHDGALVYDARRHQLLLESAVHALFDRYEREAISGFAAALERSHEFFVRVVCRTRNMSPDTFEKTWKNLGKQSERQLGCFMIIYALDVGEPYMTDQKMTELRNRVIHQGYIPSEKEAWDFGNHVFADLVSTNKFLTERHAPSLKAEIDEEMAVRSKKVPGPRPVFIMNVKPAYVDPRAKTASDISDFRGFVDAMGDKWPRKKKPNPEAHGTFH